MINQHQPRTGGVSRIADRLRLTATDEITRLRLIPMALNARHHARAGGHRQRLELGQRRRRVLAVPAKPQVHHDGR